MSPCLVRTLSRWILEPIWCTSRSRMSRGVPCSGSWRPVSRRFVDGSEREASEMKWITREHVHVDRVACPWLIRKFVDPKAEFLFVPADQVAAVAQREGATPFDIPDVELGHHGPECSFDAIVKKYTIQDPAVHELAKIVRGADTADKD